jgi:hypothetical protein
MTDVTDDGLELTWLIQRQRDKINVTYTIENRGEIIHLVDELLLPAADGLIPSNGLVVLPGENPGQIDLVAGFVNLPGWRGAVYPPATRRMTSKDVVTGDKEISFPPKAWHPWVRTALPKVDESCRTFRLCIGYITGAGPWSSHALASGGTLRTLAIGYIAPNQKFLRSTPKTLHEG